MTTNKDRLFELVVRMSAGDRVDWDRESGQLSEEERRVADELRNLDALWRTGQPMDGTTGDSSQSDETTTGLETPGMQAIPHFIDGHGHTHEVPNEWAHLRVLGELGRGAGGVVLRARDPRLDAEVALKLSPSSGAASESQLFREAQLLARVRHPNVVTVHGVEALDGWIGIWTELISGVTLEDLIARTGVLGPEEAATVVVSVCQALAAVHAEGLVHGDVKCENVMRATGGRIVLMDFGLVDETLPAAAGASVDVRGTPLYMAPEIFLRAPRSVRADIYSAGVLLFRLVTKRFPVEANDLASLLDAHRSGTRQSLVDLRPDLPQGYVAVVERALRGDPSKRISSPGALTDELLAFISGLVPGRRASGTASEERVADAQPTSPSNLPRQRTQFIGRARELGDLRRLLRRDELVTLTGPGGSGKTRLALQYAQGVLDEFSAGVWFVDLAPVSDADLFESRVASSLGVRERPGQTQFEALCEVLGQGPALLVLDNCEHLIDRAASFCDQMLQVLHQLKILATSRQALMVPGESLYVVAPLPLPRVGRDVAFEEVLDSDAMQLFALRARSVQPEFRLQRDNYLVIGEICRQLDGIPLAIELAAARIRTLEPQEMLERLEDRFRLLEQPGTVGIPRHKTLESVIDWSHGTLGTGERRLFRRLAAFSGGWTIGLAEQICGGAGLPPDQVFEAMAGLFDKSLISRDHSSGEASTRFYMLETIRQYANDKLRLAGEYEHVQGRHYEVFFELARDLDAGLGTPEQTKWIATGEIEHQNFLRALQWSLAESEDRATPLLLSSHLGRFWYSRGHITVGRSLLARALEAYDGDPNTHPRAKALHAAGSLATSQSDLAVARDLLEQAVRTAKNIPHDAGTASALTGLGNVYRVLGEQDLSRAAHEEALAIHRRTNNRIGMAHSLGNLGAHLLDSGDLNEARQVYEECLAVFEDLGDLRGIALTEHNLGSTALLDRRTRDAHRLLEQSIAHGRQLGDPRIFALTLVMLSTALVEQSREDEALEYLQEALEHYRQLGDKWGLAKVMEAHGKRSLACGHHARAARFMGAGFGIRRAIGADPNATELPDIETVNARLRVELGDERFEAEFESGASADLDSVTQMAGGHL